MRIDNNSSINGVQRIRPKHLYGLDDPAAAGRDSVELSTCAADMRAAMEALASVPEIREERVTELRAQMEQGTFDPAVDALAEKLFRTGVKSDK
jgi:flagellar biosynthesis anti-sigma factor FlgM